MNLARVNDATRPLARCVAALTLLALLASLLLPLGAGAAAVEDRKSSRSRNADSPGLSTLSADLLAISATPIPPSPHTDSLTPGVDDDDVFTIALKAGDRLTVQVSGDPGTDVDIYLLWPGSQSLLGPYAASAFSTTYPETLVFDAPTAGTYYVDLYLASAVGGAYTMTWSVGDAKNAEGFKRLSDSNRYTTALRISQATFAAGSSNDLVLASGGVYADALSASALAGSLGSPLLITETNKLSSGVLSEIKRVGAEEVHIVGGPVSVSWGVENTLKSNGLTVHRYWGRDRYAVARQVAKAVNQLNPDMDGQAFIASGEVFPDALSASPYAYRMGYPIILSRWKVVNADMLAALKEAQVHTIYIVGGPNSVGTNVEADLKKRGYNVTRIWGYDRFSTSVRTANFGIAQHWGNPSYLGVASGMIYPDALTGGSAAGASGGVVVLSLTDDLGSQSTHFVRSWSGLGLVDDARIFGGPVSVSRRAEAQFRTAAQP